VRLEQDKQPEAEELARNSFLRLEQCHGRGSRKAILAKARYGNALLKIHKAPSLAGLRNPVCGTVAYAGFRVGGVSCEVCPGSGPLIPEIELGLRLVTEAYTDMLSDPSARYDDLLDLRQGAVTAYGMTQEKYTFMRGELKSILEGRVACHGKASLRTLGTMQALSECLAQQGKLQASYEMLRACLQLTEERCGVTHPKVAGVHLEMAATQMYSPYHLIRGRRHVRRALHINREVYGESSRGVSDCYVVLSETYGLVLNLPAALWFAFKAWRSLAGALGEHHAYTNTKRRYFMILFIEITMLALLFVFFVWIIVEVFSFAPLPVAVLLAVLTMYLIGLGLMILVIHVMLCPCLDFSRGARYLPDTLKAGLA